ncbi:AST [Ectocarpus sp. CCAP 1310/34]|nr:AST [Ectocarpus sp. CCAP 1310/34]
MTKMMPFRDLPTRPRMVVPQWLPMKEDKEIKYTLSLVNGVYQMHKQEEEATNELIRTFESRDDDVFVCTFCKSGTTWVQQIITLLLNNGEQGDKNYTSVVPWMESLLFTQSADQPRGPGRDHEAKGWTLEKIKSNPERRFFKSHANLKQLPVGTAKGVKVIYVARNPKDVSVSLYHHVRNKQRNVFDGDESDMIRCFVQGRRVCENGSWFNHVLEWWEAAQADPDHVLFLHYENLLRDPEENIRKIAQFAGIEHTPKTIAKTIQASTIDAMRQNATVNTRPGENHFRKGGAGGWRDVYTVRESEAFDQIYMEQMEGTGLKMDFGEGLVMP